MSSDEAIDIIYQDDNLIGKLFPDHAFTTNSTSLSAIVPRMTVKGVPLKSDLKKIWCSEMRSDGTSIPIAESSKDLLQVFTISPNCWVPVTQSSSYAEFLLRAISQLLRSQLRYTVCFRWAASCYQIFSCLYPLNHNAWQTLRYLGILLSPYIKSNKFTHSTKKRHHILRKNHLISSLKQDTEWYFQKTASI